MIKKISTIICICLLLSSCSKETVTDTNEFGYGTASLAVHLNPSIGLETKTTAPTVKLPAELIPTLNDLSLDITGTYTTPEMTEPSIYEKHYESVVKYDKPKIPAGNYNALIKHGDIELEGIGQPYFEGTADYSIIPRKEIGKKVFINLQNSVIDLEFKEYFRKYFINAEFTIRTELKNLFDFTLDSTPSWLFVKPNCKIFISGMATKQNGVVLQFPEKELFVSVPQTKHTIMIDASTAGTLGFNIIIDNSTVNGGTTETELNPEI